MEQAIEAAAKAIQTADALVIMAGAGMGVDSGLPDFRGNEGFWRAYPPFAKLGLSFQEMANPALFRQNPALAWGFYGHRRNLYRHTVPHAGYALLRAWSEAKPGGYFVFTSNVDGQFQEAGFASDQIVECHGTIVLSQCSAPCNTDLWQDDTPVAVEESTMRAQPPFPRCPSCDRIARPNVLMFHDGTWLPERTERQTQLLEAWLSDLKGENLTVIEMGAGHAIPTVRRMSEQLQRHLGATLIRINPREPEGPSGTISLPFGAQEALQRIATQIDGQQ